MCYLVVCILFYCIGLVVFGCAKMLKPSCRFLLGVPTCLLSRWYLEARNIFYCWTRMVMCGHAEITLVVNLVLVMGNQKQSLKKSKLYQKSDIYLLACIILYSSTSKVRYTLAVEMTLGNWALVITMRAWSL